MGIAREDGVDRGDRGKSNPMMTRTDVIFILIVGLLCASVLGYVWTSDIAQMPPEWQALLAEPEPQAPEVEKKAASSPQVAAEPSSPADSGETETDEPAKTEESEESQRPVAEQTREDKPVETVEAPPAEVDEFAWLGDVPDEVRAFVAAMWERLSPEMREQMRERWESMTDEQRQQAIDQFSNMTDEQKDAMLEQMERAGNG